MNDVIDIPRSDQLDDTPHPRFAAEIFGHKSPAERLAQAAGDKLHHAWVFSGPKGIGKASFAWRVAKNLISRSSLTADWPLDGDQSILARIEALSEPRLTVVTRLYDEKTKKLKSAITVDEIRKLKARFALSAADEGWRVVILDAGDELNIAASNALLKLLEEPPAMTLFLIICHQPSNLLPTIRSRTNQLRFDPLSFDDFSQALAQAGHTIDPSQKALAILANGAPGTAINLIERDGVQTYQNLVDLAYGAPRLDRKALAPFVNQLTTTDGAAKFDLITGLFQILLARMARFGATQAPDIQTAAQNEAQLFGKLAPNLQAAQAWADLHSKIDQEYAHAKQVNLDPSQSLLNMFLQFAEIAKGVTS